MVLITRYCQILIQGITTFVMEEKSSLTHFIIAGPTASGKSQHALQLAQDVGGIIANADSLQIYKGLPILTAQPDAQECAQVPHVLYNFCDPAQPYSAQNWVRDITAILEKAEAPVVIVGGTGFYLKALLEGLSPIPDVDPVLQETLRTLPLSEIRLQLESLDPVMFERLHPHDHQRNLRALEVVMSSGKSLQFWQSLKSTPCPYAFHKIGIFPEKEFHENAMVARVFKMWERGAVVEVQAMMDRNIAKNAPAKKAIGYAEIEAYLQGQLSQEEAQQLMILKTRQYAKRQRTWFRNQIVFDSRINLATSGAA